MSASEADSEGEEDAMATLGNRLVAQTDFGKAPMVVEGPLAVLTLLLDLARALQTGSPADEWRDYFAEVYVSRPGWPAPFAPPLHLVEQLGDPGAWRITAELALGWLDRRFGSVPPLDVLIRTAEPFAPLAISQSLADARRAHSQHPASLEPAPALMRSIVKTVLTSHLGPLELEFRPPFRMLAPANDADLPERKPRRHGGDDAHSLRSLNRSRRSSRIRASNESLRASKDSDADSSPEVPTTPTFRTRRLSSQATITRLKHSDRRRASLQLTPPSVASDRMSPGPSVTSMAPLLANTYVRDERDSPTQPPSVVFSQLDLRRSQPSPDDRLRNQLSEDQRRALVKQRSKLLRLLGEPVSPREARHRPMSGVAVTRTIDRELSDPGSPRTSPRLRFRQRSDPILESPPPVLSDSSPPTEASNPFSPFPDMRSAGWSTSETSPETTFDCPPSDDEDEDSPTTARRRIDARAREDKRKRLDKLHRFLGERVDPSLMDQPRPMHVKSPSLGYRASRLVGRSTSLFLRRNNRSPKSSEDEAIAVDLRRDEPFVPRSSEDSLAGIRQLRKIESVLGELPPVPSRRELYGRTLSSLQQVRSDDEAMEDLAEAVYGDASPELDPPHRVMIRRAHKLQRMLGTTRGEVFEAALRDIVMAVHEDSELDDEARQTILADCRSLAGPGRH